MSNDTVVEHWVTIKFVIEKTVEHHPAGTSAAAYDGPADVEHRTIKMEASDGAFTVHSPDLLLAMVRQFREFAKYHGVDDSILRELYPDL